MHRGVYGHDPAGARVIFTAHEVGHTEEPAAPSASRAALQSLVNAKTGQREALDDDELLQRAHADRSSATVTFVFLSCGVGWLILGSLDGLTASIKLHYPDWLAGYEGLTFGRIRTIYLNAGASGLTAMAG